MDVLRTMNVYRLRVTLAQGPYDEGEGTWRMIEIRGNQTLVQLHRAIFTAFDRWEEHLYSFFMSKDRRDATQEYASPHFFEDGDCEFGTKPRNAGRVKLDALGLRARKKFYYTFDYGDDWEHVVEVLAINDQNLEGRYPRIVEKFGESPPQYPEWDEDEDEDDSDAEEGVRGRVIPLRRAPEGA